MKIIDLTDEHKELFLKCLEDWSDEMKESGCKRACWYDKMQEKGLRVKLALDDRGEVGGMIQYCPVEFSPADGKEIYFVPCIWIHGHKKGRGNFQKKGMGKALLQAAEEDCKNLGVKGLAVWGISLPFWMRASWFKKRGYRAVDKNKMAVLLFKSFVDGAEPPRWIQQKKTPGKESGKVVISAFNSGWCSAMNITYERAKRAAAEFSNVEFREYNTFDREVFLEWGIMDEVFIDSKRLQNGPPPSYKKIYKKMNNHVKKMK